jgi:hypothetical protein
MNGFFESLPWKLSALGALIILAAGFSVELDPWVALQRAGLGFIGFWILGSVGRKLFGTTATHIAEPVKKSPATASEQKRTD